jgi:hypothetical protein
VADIGAAFLGELASATGLRSGRRVAFCGKYDTLREDYVALSPRCVAVEPRASAHAIDKERSSATSAPLRREDARAGERLSARLARLVCATLDGLVVARLQPLDACPEDAQMILCASIVGPILR